MERGFAVRILLTLVIGAALAWSGWWYLGAAARDRAISAWIEARAAEGWVAETAGLGTQGFPNRFDTTIEAPDFADPETGLAWRASFVQFLSLSYRPGDVIAVWPDTQTVATPVQTIDVDAEDMRASLSVRGARLTLNRMTWAAEDLALSSTEDWQVRAEQAQLAVRRSPETPDSYDLALDLEDVAPPAVLSRLLARTGGTEGDAPALGEAVLRATVAFDTPWDLRALETARPQPRRIAIDAAEARWGTLSLQMRGTVTVDAEGVPDGEVTLRATNWRTMLEVAQTSGAISRDLGQLLAGGLDLIARLSGSNDAIDAPLRLRDGAMTLGGVLPLGPAPRIVLR